MKNRWSIKGRLGALSPAAQSEFERCRLFLARASYEKALALTQQEPERQFLQERIRQLK